MIRSLSTVPDLTATVRVKHLESQDSSFVRVSNAGEEFQGGGGGRRRHSLKAAARLQRGGANLRINMVFNSVVLLGFLLIRTVFISTEHDKKAASFAEKDKKGARSTDKDKKATRSATAGQPHIQWQPEDNCLPTALAKGKLT